MNEIPMNPKKVIFCLLLLSAVPFFFIACGGKPILGGGDATDPGAIINGVTWATRNVDAPGTFAETPESLGMFYQRNSNIGWSSSDPIKNTKGNSFWRGKGSYWGSYGGYIDWEDANDPCPEGWRLPIMKECKGLLETEKVIKEWTIQNGRNGMKFTDKASGNSIFLPVAGFRDAVDGVLYNVTEGRYATSTYPHYVFFYKGKHEIVCAIGNGSYALDASCIRCVHKERKEETPRNKN